MGALHTTLRRGAPANARRGVDVFVRELPEYRALAARPDDHARMLDFGVFFRRRGAELAAGDQPFTAGDLAVMADVGEERGRAGVPPAVVRHAVTLSVAASIREISEAAGPTDLDDTLHLLSWLGREGEICQQAFILGVLRGEKAHQPVIGRARRLADLALVRTVADGTGQPCAAGAATGPPAMLADVFTMARRVSRVAPARTVPDQVHIVADLFLEIGVAESPEIDEWLRGVARQLAEGPDLVPTLDAFYRNDLDRPRTASTLNIHPRTLDYRLRRARQLTGFDPRDTTGIRVFTTAITRAHG